MKNLFSLLLSIFLIAYSGCKKDPFENKTIIQGHLLEYGTDKPIANSAIYLRSVDGEIFGPQYWTTHDSVFTDENGYIYYEFDHNELSINACFFATPDGYYPIKEHSINYRQVNDITSYAGPFAWLELHIKNANPVDWNDNIRLACMLGGPSGWEEFPGPSIDETVIWKVSGNRSGELLWKVTKDGILQEYSDTLLCPAHDTLHYEILY